MIGCARILLLIAIAAGCGSQGSPAAPMAPPTSTRLSARIDGMLWSTERVFVSQARGMTTITAADANVSTTLAISMSDPLTTGIRTIEYREDQTSFVAFFEGAPNGPGWTTSSPDASGQIDLTTVTNRTLEGTFSFVLDPFGGGATGAKIITDGTFIITR